MKTRQIIKKIARQALPTGTWRYHQARRLLERFKASRTSSLAYETWVAKVEPNLPASIVNEGPLISIVVPAYNTPDQYLHPLMDSIIGQTYINWELVLVQASPDAKRAQAIKKAAGRDKRIQLVELADNQGIAGNTNEGLKAAKGQYVAFLDHDDVLAPFALAEVAAALQQDPAIDLFYSDEDKLSDDGQYRSLPFFKPAWSPELFMSANYLAHFVVVRNALAQKVKGIRLGYDGAQDYDFLLRVLDHKPKVHAIQRMSYHWRQAVGSTGMEVGQKSYAMDAGSRALTDYVKRNHIPAKVVEVVGRPTEYRLQYKVQGSPTVYVVADAITFNRLSKVTNYPNLQRIAKAADATGLLLQLDPTAVPLSDTWLTELIGLAQQPYIAWVGGLVRNQQQRIAGIGYTLQQRIWQPLMTNADDNAWTPMGPAIWPRNLLAVNPACALIELKKLKALSDDGHDVLASGLAAATSGYRNVYWPYAGVSVSDEPKSYLAKVTTQTTDPYVNANLSVAKGQLVLKPQP